MAKDKEEKEIAVDPKEADRKKRWEAYVAAYKLKNPVKGARKEANGEFAQVPASFR